MPVEFEAYDPSQGRIDLAEGTNAHRIISFLVGHADLGFTPKEIHDATGVARGSVGPTLRRLAEHGLVRHKGEYWAAADDERIASIASVALSMDAVDERFGDDWYGRNPDWAEGLPDLGERDEPEESGRPAGRATSSSLRTRSGTRPAARTSSSRTRRGRSRARTTSSPGSRRRDGWRRSH